VGVAPRMQTEGGSRAHTHIHTHTQSMYKSSWAADPLARGTHSYPTTAASKNVWGLLQQKQVCTLYVFSTWSRYICVRNVHSICASQVCMYTFCMCIPSMYVYILYISIQTQNVYIRPRQHQGRVGQPAAAAGAGSCGAWVHIHVCVCAGVCVRVCV